MSVFDASVLIPLFMQRHPHHEAAKKHFENADLVLLHPCVIDEFTTVSRRLANDQGLDGNRYARTSLQALLNEPRVRVRSEMNYDDVVALYLAAPRLSFTDAVVQRLALDQKTKPLSFDTTASTPPARL